MFLCSLIFKGYAEVLSGYRSRSCPGPRQSSPCPSMFTGYGNIDKKSVFFICHSPAFGVIH